ncbi:hypothetical protein EVAR_53927_1 [Eumeta japonica]|uniref:Uncharacterized protein n=1 Tax=Eumeta variegata TaxID=151549 RepID=A0A4C1YLH6_EUMVA|nr:hypothetical protein EVAR_53927_1 [Eumeta japonica]
MNEKTSLYRMLLRQRLSEKIHTVNVCHHRENGNRGRHRKAESDISRTVRVRVVTSRPSHRFRDGGDQVRRLKTQSAVSRDSVGQALRLEVKSDSSGMERDRLSSRK